MDIKTLSEVAKQLPPSISVLIRADHGVGKSELVHQLAEHFGLPLLDRRMSQCTEGDTLGLPKLIPFDGNDITTFCPPEFIDRACREPVLLFLDEINRATNEVQQACFQYALDRCDFKGRRFHSETRVYSAVNNSSNYNVSVMDPAFLDRFYVCDLQPTAEDFFAHAETRAERLGGPINADMLRFLKERPTRLDPASANPGSIQPSRRSWVRLDRVFAGNKIYQQDLDEDDALKGRAYSLAVGFVGLEAAADLVDYLAKRETRFNATHILDDYAKNREKIKRIGQDKFITLIDLLCEDSRQRVWTNEQAANLGEFIGDCPAELRVSFMTNFTRGLRNHPHFQPNFTVINGHVIKHIVHVFNPDANLGGKAPPSTFGGTPDVRNCLKDGKLPEKKEEETKPTEQPSEPATTPKKKTKK